MKNNEVNPARSLYYGFLSKMLVFTEAPDRFDGIREVLDVMIENPLDVNSQEALREIRDHMIEGDYHAVIEEYDELFHNPESAIVRTTASYYDEGVESGKKRLEVKQFLAKTRIRRDEQHYTEPEDSMGFLLTFMHDLIELQMAGDEAYASLAHCVFDEILNAFGQEFIVELYEHEQANIYRSLAIVMQAFWEFERLYLDVPKPVIQPRMVRDRESGEMVS